MVLRFVRPQSFRTFSTGTDRRGSLVVLLRAPFFVEFEDRWTDGKMPGEDGDVFEFVWDEVLIGGFRLACRT